VDLGGVSAVNAVKDGGLAIGLANVNGGVAADVKALPVDDGLLAALRDLHVGASLADGDLAGSHLAARRKLIRCWWRRRRTKGTVDDKGAEGEAKFRIEPLLAEAGHDEVKRTAQASGGLAARGAMTLDELGDCLPAVMRFVPDDSEYVVHACEYRDSPAF